MSCIRVAVVGLGIAGKVRIRDLLQTSQFTDLKHVQLHGYISRRQVDIPGAQQVQLSDVLTDPLINVIIICTENALHESLARQCIEAGKHVLVEYPLALSASEAKSLLDLAEKKGVVCYEEDISLLTPQHQMVKEMVQNKPRLEQGRMYLEGRFNGWIEDCSRNGSAFHSSISMIQQLIGLFGDLTPVSATIIRTDHSLRTEGTVTTTNSGIINISILREKLDQPKRVTGFYFKFDDGSEIDSKTLPVSIEHGKLGLFMLDLKKFFQCLEDGVTRPSNEHVIIQSLTIADALHDLAVRNPHSEGI